LERLRNKGFTYEGETTLKEIADFVNCGKGFVVVLVDIDQIPTCALWSTSRPRVNRYQGHFLIVYSVNSNSKGTYERVKVLDPTGDSGKDLTYKVSDFERGRLVPLADQSCIFIRYNFKCCSKYE
jgi:hypothetical protein